jgi:hypothetical protein
VELTFGEVEERLSRIQQQIDAQSLPVVVRDELEAFEAAAAPARGRTPGAIDLFFGEIRVRARLALLRRHLRAAGADLSAITSVVDVALERAMLARRLAHLQRTRHLFELWHVFHRPLVFGLFAIVVVHVGIALFFGYATVT